MKFNIQLLKTAAAIAKRGCQFYTWGQSEHCPVRVRISVLQQFDLVLSSITSFKRSWLYRPVPAGVHGGLEAAATLTNLEIEIPKYHHTSDELVHAL